MLAKSVYVPLSAAVTPTLGGAGWLLNLMKKHSSSSLADSRVSVPSARPCLVERPEVLVEVAGAEGVPAVQLGDDGEVAEPVRTAAPRGSRAARGPGHARQTSAIFCSSGRRAAGRPSPASASASSAWRSAKRMTASQAIGHRPQLLALVEGLGIALEVERGLGRRDLRLEVEHALPVDLAVRHGVARRALLHELGEAARVVRVLPVLRQLAEHLVAHRAAAPERDDVSLVLGDDATGPRCTGSSGRESRIRRSSALWHVSSG